MINVERIYGKDVDTKAWETMPYKEVLELKYKLADEQIKLLNTAYYMHKDSANITDCVNAMKFNATLLKELKC